MSEVVDEGYEEPPLPLSERAKPNGTKPYWHNLESIIVGEWGLEYLQAMLEVQKELGPLIEADADGQHNKYATLGKALKELRPVLNKHGFIVTQGSGHVRSYGEGQYKWHALPVHTTFTHAETGQFQTHIIPMPLEKKTAWAVGSAQTYGKRYSFLSPLGVATADDDGKAASTDARLDTDGLSKSGQIIKDKIEACKSEKELTEFHEKNAEAFSALDELELVQLRQAYSDKMKALKAENGNGKAGAK